MSISKQLCNSVIELFRFYVVIPALFIITAFINPVSSQEDCETAKAIVKKTELAAVAKKTAEDLKKDFNNLPELKPKPSGNKDAATAKTDLDAARIKWDNSKAAVTEAKKSLKAGSDATSLAQEIARKKTELTGKQEEFKKRDLATYIKNGDKITKLEKKLTDNMVGFNRSNANEILNNKNYKKFDPANTKIINACNELKKTTINPDMNYKTECESEMATKLLAENNYTSEDIKKLRQDLQNAVTSTNASGTVSTESKKNPWDEIRKKDQNLYEK